MALETPDQPIPLTILTGFLGAGKTTLLNRILHADHGLKVAVLVNDFGSINIDSQLIVGVEGEAISLANGCICCTIRGDLLNTALGLLGRRDPPEYLISVRALRHMLMDLPEAVFRAKGLIYLAEAPTRRAVLQAVGPRISLTLAEPWGEAAPQNQVVCLSAPGQLDTAALQAAFDDCLADLPAEAAVPAQQSWLRGGAA